MWKYSSVVKSHAMAILVATLMNCREEISHSTQGVFADTCKPVYTFPACSAPAPACTEPISLQNLLA